MCCSCISTTQRVRVIVFADLVIALLYTIYRVTKLSLDLKRVFGIETHRHLTRTNHDNSSLAEISLKKFSTVFFITASVIGLAIEIFLFFLLSNGARSKNYRHCKHWLIVRLFLFVLTVLASMIEYIRGEYSVINGVLELEKAYRIYTLIVVRNFMQEIYKGMSSNHFEATSSIAEGFGIPSINLRSHSHSHVTF